MVSNDLIDLLNVEGENQNKKKENVWEEIIIKKNSNFHKMVKHKVGLGIAVELYWVGRHTLFWEEWLSAGL